MHGYISSRNQLCTRTPILTNVATAGAYLRILGKPRISMFYVKELDKAMLRKEMYSDRWMSLSAQAPMLFHIKHLCKDFSSHAMLVWDSPLQPSLWINHSLLIAISEALQSWWKRNSELKPRYSTDNGYIFKKQTIIQEHINLLQKSRYHTMSLRKTSSSTENAHVTVFAWG